MAPPITLKRRGPFKLLPHGDGTWSDRATRVRDSLNTAAARVLPGRVARTGRSTAPRAATFNEMPVDVNFVIQNHLCGRDLENLRRVNKRQDDNVRGHTALRDEREARTEARALQQALLVEIRTPVFPNLLPPDRSGPLRRLASHFTVGEAQQVTNQLFVHTQAHGLAGINYAFALGVIADELGDRAPAFVAEVRRHLETSLPSFNASSPQTARGAMIVAFLSECRRAPDATLRPVLDLARNSWYVGARTLVAHLSPVFTVPHAGATHTMLRRRGLTVSPALARGVCAAVVEQAKSDVRDRLPYASSAAIAMVELAAHFPHDDHQDGAGRVLRLEIVDSAVDIARMMAADPRSQAAFVKALRHASMRNGFSPDELGRLDAALTDIDDAGPA